MPKLTTAVPLVTTPEEHISMPLPVTVGPALVAPTPRSNLKKRVPSAARLNRIAPLTSRTSPIKSFRPRLHSRHSSKGSGSEYEDSEDSTESSGAMFPEYCAYCEKQIEDTSSSGLYCSTSCKDRDINSAQEYELFSEDTPAPYAPTRALSQPDIPVKNIIPQLSPTILPKSHSYSHSHSHMPTSPGLPSARPPTPLKDDFYLAHFRSPSQSTLRPTYDTKTPTYNGTNTPALSTTATSTSTFNASSRPYTPRSYTSIRGASTRNGSVSSKSVDLVTPIHYYPTTTTTPSSLKTITEGSSSGQKSFGKSEPLKPSTEEAQQEEEAEQKHSWEKKRTVKCMAASMPTSGGSLKQLFKFDEMRGALPSPAKPSS